MNCLLASLLLVAVLLGPYVQACRKHSSTSPPISPCTLCDIGSFYKTDEKCEDSGADCQFLPSSEVVTETVTATGCKKALLTCPPGSLVTSYTDGNGDQTTEPWTDFVSNAEQTEIICNDESKWQLIFGEGPSEVVASLESIFCFTQPPSPNITRDCTQCPDLPPPTPEQCLLLETCTAPKRTYNYDTPTPGAVCRQLQMECSPIPITSDALLITVTYADNTTRIFTPEQLSNGETTFVCNGQGGWNVITPGEVERSISSVACIYTYSG